MTLDESLAAVRAFCSDRDWDQFHAPKNLAIGITTEAAELLSHFRFVPDDLSGDVLLDPAKRQAVADELADVFFFVLRFADRTGIDLGSALESKLAKNAEHYPVEKSRGKNIKYTEL